MCCNKQDAHGVYVLCEAVDVFTALVPSGFSTCTMTNVLDDCGKKLQAAFDV